MKSARPAVTFLSVAGALGVASVSLSACDASPYAATVNGHEISVLSLNHQLSEWSANKAWVSEFDSSSAASAQQNGGPAPTVAGTGGKGTYSTSFAADILDIMVQKDIVHQHLVATRQVPTGDEEIAARAVNEYLHSTYWDQFSPALRQFIVDQLAEQAPLTPLSTDTETLQSAFSKIEPYLFSRVCLQTASAFSKSDADSIVASGNFSGATICYDQTQLEQQSQALQAAVRALSPGKIAPPIATSYGFEVIRLASRDTPGLSRGVTAVLSAATATTEPAQLGDVLAKARVQVNPAYGTWSQGQVTPNQLGGS